MKLLEQSSNIRTGRVAEEAKVGVTAQFQSLRSLAATEGGLTADTRSTRLFTTGSQDSDLFYETNTGWLFRWTGTAWSYIAGIYSATDVNRTALTLSAADNGAWFYATDTKIWWQVSGAVWVQRDVAQDSGVLFASTSAANSSGATETDLVSVSIPANTLGDSFESIDFVVVGSFNANANNKTIRVKYGSTTFFNSGAMAVNGGAWMLRGTLIRGGTSSVQYLSCTLTTENGGTVVKNTLGSESHASTLNFKVTGQGTANSDVGMKFYKGWYSPGV